MNRKLILALALVLIAAVMATAVSADEKITIDGIDFNIPDGYTEDVDNAIVNQTNSSNGVTYVSNGKVYENGDNFAVMVVSSYDGYNLTDDDAAAIGGGEEITINGEAGYFMDTYILKVFYFAKDGKLVSVSTNNDADLEKFVI